MYRLMIVDDEDITRNGLVNYIPWNELGYDVVATAANGREALELLAEKQVDVMLCDILMPVLSGLELVQILQQRSMKTKTVFISGYREFEYAQKALEYGVRSYILKPTKYKELSEVFLKLKSELDREHMEKVPVKMPAAADAGEEACAPCGIIESIRSFVMKNYTDVTLSEVAEHVHLSPFYVSRLFRQKTGRTFYDFVLETRMAKAVELLLHTEYKIYEIGEQVGYKNTKSFLKIFKRHYKKGPNAYRKAAK